MPPVSVMQMLLPTLVNGEYSFDTAALDTDGVKLLQKWVQKYTNRGLPRHLAGNLKRKVGSGNQSSWSTTARAKVELPATILSEVVDSRLTLCKSSWGQAPLSIARG